MIILLSGGGGRLGTELKKLLIHTDSSRPARTITLIAPGIGEWDITKLEDCIRVLKKYKPDAVVHAAAYTNVAKAEEEKDVCRRINVAGTANVANTIKEVQPQAHLIYISTDYVFGGDKGNYKEEDATRPVNFYALTKPAFRRGDFNACPSAFLESKIPRDFSRFKIPVLQQFYCRNGSRKQCQCYNR